MRKNKMLELKKKMRMLTGVTCAALMLAGTISVPVRAEASNGAERAQETEAKAFSQIRLSVGKDQETPVFQAADKVKLEINISNTGNLDAQNVRIAPVIAKESEWPFEMNRMNWEQEVGTIEAGKTITAVWGTDEDKLTVREDVTGNAYKLVFHITYNDGEKGCETDKYVFVKSTAKEKPPAESGNSGEGGANTGNNQNTQISSGVTENQSGKNTESQDAGTVYNSEPVVTGGFSGSGSSENSSVPRVIVTGFETQPGEVRAGSNFKLIIHLKNTSGKTAVSNMLFDLQAPSSGTEAAAEAPAFLPASGSSSVYLDNIPAGGTKDISIELNARADLIQKPYSIAMTMKYEDSRSTQYEAQSSLAIPIVQKARFEFGKIQIAPDPVTAGEEVNISCSLYNLGRVKMYNVKAKFEGEAIETQEQFVGNLDSGATGSIDMIVKAKEKAKGKSECKLLLSYEDDAGNVSTSEQKFSVNVETAADIVNIDDAQTVTEQEGGFPVFAVVAAAILAAGGGTAAVIAVKRRKRMMEEAEEEELFDEVERFTEDEHQ